MTETASVATRLLTGAQREAFRRQGYLFPLRALSPAEAQAARARLEAFEASQGGPLSAGFRTKYHDRIVEEGKQIFYRAVDWDTPGAANG